MTAAGEQRFNALRALGQALERQEWPELTVRGRYQRELLELAAAHRSDQAAQRVLAALDLLGRVNSLDAHYLKRRYQDGLPVDSPDWLNQRFETILDADALLYRQSSGNHHRWIALDSDSGWVAIY